MKEPLSHLYTHKRTHFLCHTHTHTHSPEESVQRPIVSTTLSCPLWSRVGQESSSPSTGTSWSPDRLAARPATAQREEGQSSYVWSCQMHHNMHPMHVKCTTTCIIRMSNAPQHASYACQMHHNMHPMHVKCTKTCINTFDPLSCLCEDRKEPEQAVVESSRRHYGVLCNTNCLNIRLFSYKQLVSWERWGDAVSVCWLYWLLA